MKICLSKKIEVSCDTVAGLSKLFDSAKKSKRGFGATPKNSKNLKTIGDKLGRLTGEVSV